MSIYHRALATTGLLVLCCQGTTAPAAEKAEFTVLPSAQVTHLERLCSREGPERVTSGWNPAFSQVRQADALLPAFVAKNRRPERPLSDYYRQYLGIVINGKRLIYVNVFPRSLVERREFPGTSGDFWLSEYVDVCDGGDDFWGAVFDLEEQLFFSPRFNGVAKVSQEVTEVGMVRFFSLCYKSCEISNKEVGFLITSPTSPAPVTSVIKGNRRSR